MVFIHETNIQVWILKKNIYQSMEDISEQKHFSVKNEALEL